MNADSTNKKPIRILQVLTIMNRGGAETMIMNYYRAMDRTQVQFDFLLHRKEKGAFDDEIIALGGKIYRMPAISPKKYFKYKKQLYHFFLENKNYQIIHCHLNALSSIILSVAKKNKVGVRIAHSHIAIEPFKLKKFFNKNTDKIAMLKDIVQSAIKYKVINQASHFFACGEKAGLWLYGKKNIGKVVIIKNAINASLFIYNRNEAIKIKKSLNLLDKKIIGHVGRFNEQKNHFFIIDIFNDIVNLDKDCMLLLIGDGHLKPEIEKKVKTLGLSEHVIFLGVKDNIPSLLQAIDFFLFPSLYEGLPVTLMEAQAAGLKILTSNTVSEEVKVTSLVTFLSLKTPTEIWAKNIITQFNYNRENTSKSIIDAGYDIETNVQKLQNFYLNPKNYVWN